MILTLKRYRFTKNETIGKLYIDNTFLCDTIEPPLQPNQQHPKGCILEGYYEIKVTHSNKFNRPLPLLYRVPNFEGMRIHAGNNHNHTAGCILVGEIYLRDIPTLAQSKKFEQLLVNNLIKAQQNEKIYIHIHSTVPTTGNYRLPHDTTRHRQ
jgi:hypothetical protein